MSLGHYSLQEDAMFREASGDIECGNDVLREKKKEEDDIHPNQANDDELPIFSALDPGFFQNPIIDDEIFHAINLVELSDTEFDPPSTETTIFLDMEASEVRSNCPPAQKLVISDSHYFYTVFFNKIFWWNISTF